MFNEPEPKDPPKPKETYPWKYEDDVLETRSSIKSASALVGKPLSNEGVK